MADHALTISFGNVINLRLNNLVIAIWNDLKQQPLPGRVDLVPAYSSLTVVYDPIEITRQFAPASVSDWMKEQLATRINHVQVPFNKQVQTIQIPVCYDQSLAPDLEYIAKHHGLTTTEVIQIHASTTYRVYMIGFLPGFPYMAAVSSQIATPRKTQPQQLVTAGSVGIAGEQTGIYPFDSPGGWQIIGNTPIRMFDPAKEQPGLLAPGDEVQFYPVSLREFKQLQA